MNPIETSSRLEKKRKGQHEKSKTKFNEDLPIYRYKDAIIDSVQKNATTIIVGETGAGKSTQLPQYLIDSFAPPGVNPPKCIVCTQPRRVAAVTIAQKVACEQHTKVGQKVGYSIRFDDRTSKSTRVKFATDGVLLRECMLDPNLSRYSVVLLDEVHERSLQTDILMGLLRQLQERRKDLRIVVMSATLQVQVFSSFFKDANIISIPGRQYPVEILYTKEPEPDYIDAAMLACLQVHESEEQGGVLVFLPGQDDIESLQQLLEENLPYCIGHQSLRDCAPQVHNITENPNLPGISSGSGDSCKDIGSKNDRSSGAKKQRQADEGIGITAGDKSIFQFNGSGSRGSDGEGGSGSRGNGGEGGSGSRGNGGEGGSDGNSSEMITVVAQRDFQIRPLYAAMPPDEQLSVFQSAPLGVRKFIISTNIAETSVTISGIKYVIDAGFVKTRFISPTTGVEMLKVLPVSRFQADQRAGRAGRESAGKCLRLYTEDTYLNSLPEAALPEIQRTNIAQVLLQLKFLGISQIAQFPFVSPPTTVSQRKALELLLRLGAIDKTQGLTQHGKRMAALPLEPIFAHLLLKADELRCVSEVLTAVALLSADALLLQPHKEADKRAAAQAHKHFASKDGDLPTLLNIYNSWQKAKKDRHWASRNYLSQRSLQHAESVREQLCSLLRSSRLGVDVTSSCGEHDREPFLRCLLVGLSLNIARRAATYDPAGNGGGRNLNQRQHQQQQQQRPPGISKAEAQRQKLAQMQVNTKSMVGVGSGDPAPCLTLAGTAQQQHSSSGSAAVAQSKFSYTDTSSSNGGGGFRRAADPLLLLGSSNSSTAAGGGGAGVAIDSAAPYVTVRGNQPVHIHPTSVLFSLSSGGRRNMPEFVVYAELLVTSKQYMRCVTAIDGAWLPQLLPSQFKTTTAAAAPPAPTEAAGHKQL